MKRSEMITNISIELMSRLPEWEKQERLNFAEELLQCVEINGMLPPQVGDYNVAQIILDKETDDATCVHYWEPEDEN